MKKILTLTEQDRLSTQKLLEQIRREIYENGETDFEIEACGQHMIGGPLAHPDGKKLSFTVSNPGQRVGAMALPGTTVKVTTSAPADAGWLCSGGHVIVLGDSGDTTAHCQAGGLVYVGGKAGARSGALMKHDPAFSPPEFWVLESVGSFGFEFMGGGVAIVCGLDVSADSSPLGYRSCVGMVGGQILVRGKTETIYDKDVKVVSLTEEDWAFLQEGLPRFLKAVNKNERLPELLEDRQQWQKIVPKTKLEKSRDLPESLKTYKARRWFPGTAGLFSDILPKDYSTGQTYPLAGAEEGRYLRPVWVNTNRPPCEYHCPSSVPTADIFRLFREEKPDEAFALWLQYTPFPASVCGYVCPKLCAQHCTRSEIDFPVSNTELARLSLEAQAPKTVPLSQETVAVIGGGPAGLSVAWQLAIKGRRVTVFEAEYEIAGKMKNAIPPARLARQVLSAEIARIKKMPIEFMMSTHINAEKFEEILKDFDRVVISVGTHRSRFLPVAGNERVQSGLDFLKTVNREDAVLAVAGQDVVVIGAGNVGMDIAIQAADMGAENVTVVDIQQPGAFDREMEMAIDRGAKILWPKKIEKVTDTDVVFTDGGSLPADFIFIAIGELPETDWLGDTVKRDVGGWVEVDSHGRTSNPRIFACGDAVSPGLITDAIGKGQLVAKAIDAEFAGTPLKAEDQQQINTEKVKKVYIERCNLNDEDDGDNPSKCLSCGTCRYCEICTRICPTNAISKVTGKNGLQMVSDDSMCIGCGFCASACPSGIWSMVQNY